MTRASYALPLFLLLGCRSPSNSATSTSTSPPPLPQPTASATSAQAPVPPSTARPAGQGALRLRVYVAGESIERRNRYVAPPFLPTGALNDRGGGEARNADDEYGWMIPLADRLRLRDPSIEVAWVGSDHW